ncbi:MAG: helix-turn-helix domain-containing protein [bacterium]|nr:helix-turn-helix domain-containing protein [bacterium]
MKSSTPASTPAYFYQRKTVRGLLAGLPGRAILLLEELSRCAHADRTCRIHPSVFGRILGVSVRQIRRHLAALEDRGLLRRDYQFHGGGGSSMTVHLTPPGGDADVRSSSSHPEEQVQIPAPTKQTPSRAPVEDLSKDGRWGKVERCARKLGVKLVAGLRTLCEDRFIERRKDCDMPGAPGFPEMTVMEGLVETFHLARERRAHSTEGFMAACLRSEWA